MINNIEKAAEIIKAGGLVAFPTETVYGLGANALNPVAVARIFEAKERPSFDPLIVHIASIDDLNRLALNLTEEIFAIAHKFWPGPLTLVLPKSNIVPDIVTSDLPTVGIRMPDNEIALQLIRQSGCPIAAPSANKFGQLSPVNAKHVKKQLPNIDFILDGGNTHVGIESTIISVEGNICQILRPGYITRQHIEDAFPGKFVFIDRKPEKLVAPGLLKSHYAPKKPLYIVSDINNVFPAGSGLILHGLAIKKHSVEKVIYTSEKHSKTEVAANLFSALHAMEDDDTIQQIYIEPVEEEGLGIAIMDRLRKAAFQYSVDSE